ncbi:hypothetical protein ACSQ67_012746 [Phaseolus vulgaris]
MNQASNSVQNQAMSESLSLLFLPNDLVVEILSRLPVKSLLQFSPSTICDDLNYPVKNKISSYGIVGSCNGLLCFAIKGDCALLWNPSTRVSKKSPPFGNNWRSGCFTAFGLGYDHVTEDYKVVAVFYDPNEIYSECKVKVYSMATNSWRKIQDFPYGASKVKKMWRLKIGDGGKNPYIFSTNNFVGRQIWEFDSEAGTDEERAQVEAARQDFYQNRFKLKACGDRLWRFQILREKKFKQKIRKVKIEDDEEITWEKATLTLKRTSHYLSALQTSDGHWPAHLSGSHFFLPIMVISIYSTGHLDSVLRKNIVKKFSVTYIIIE